MKIKHKGKVYIIEIEKYKTVEDLLSDIKAPKNEWTFTVYKDMGRCGLGLSHREQIARNFKTVDDAKKYIKTR